MNFKAGIGVIVSIAATPRAPASEEAVSKQRASCLHRGNTFYGEFVVVGEGPSAEVRVRYNGDELSARAAGRPVEVVAQAILRELVVLEAIGTKVIEASGQRGSSVIGSDAR